MLQISVRARVQERAQVPEVCVCVFTRAVRAAVGGLLMVDRGAVCSELLLLLLLTSVC